MKSIKIDIYEEITETEKKNQMRKNKNKKLEMCK